MLNWSLGCPCGSLFCTDSSVAKDRLSDAGGPRFESQTGRVTGEPTSSLLGDKRPAMEGIWSPEHHAGHSMRTKHTLPSQKHNSSSEHHAGHSIRTKILLNDS